MQSKLVSILAVSSAFVFLVAAFVEPGQQQVPAGSDLISVSSLRAIKLTNLKRVSEAESATYLAWSHNPPFKLAYTSAPGIASLYSTDTGKTIHLDRHLVMPPLRWSSDDRAIVFRSTSVGGMTISRLDARTGEAQILATGSDLSLPELGRSGVIRYHSASGVTTTGSSQGAANLAEAFVYQKDDNVHLVLGASDSIITDGRGKYFMPELSPDRRRVLFHEISAGLFVYDIASQTTIPLGQGDDASWSPDGLFIVADVTQHDGHQTTSSQIVFINLAGDRVTLATGLDVIPLYPTLANDGRTLAFSSRGSIYVGTLSR